MYAGTTQPAHMMAQLAISFPILCSACHRGRPEPHSLVPWPEPRHHWLKVRDRSLVRSAPGSDRCSRLLRLDPLRSFCLSVAQAALSAGSAAPAYRALARTDWEGAPWLAVPRPGLPVDRSRPACPASQLAAPPGWSSGTGSRRAGLAAA